jgi:hypothetical protein
MSLLMACDSADPVRVGLTGYGADGLSTDGFDRPQIGPDTIEADDTVEVDNDTAQVTNDTVEVDNDTAQVTNDTVEVDNDTAQVTNDTVEADNDTAQVTNDTAEVDNDTAQVTNDTVEVDNDTAQVTNDTVEADNDTAQVTSDTAQVDNDTAQVTNDTVEVDNDTAQVTNDTLQEAVAEEPLVEEPVVEEPVVEVPVVEEPEVDNGIDECVSSYVDAPLIITAVFDGPLGGNPKVVELYAIEPIADLSAFGLGSATNGGGSDGVEFTFPRRTVTAGTFLYVTSNLAAFQSYFGFAADHSSSAVNVNGDDGIELFWNGELVDAFGDATHNGVALAWNYTDGWATRRAGSSPTPDFDLADWTLSGLDATDGCTADATCRSRAPFSTYTAPPNPCGLGRCIDTPSTFTCDCPTGMVFDRSRGSTCVACDALPNCASTACSATGATCLVCDPGFTQDRTTPNGTCQPDACAAFPCQGLDEVCVDLPNPAPVAANGRRCDGPFDDLEGLLDDALAFELHARIDDHVAYGYYPGTARQALYSIVDVFGGRVECIYTGRTVAAEDPDATPIGDDTTLPPIDTTPERDCRLADGSPTTCSFSTEHSWPQSRGAEDEPARSDMHHLFPTENLANIMRSNNLYGETACTGAGCQWSVGGSELGLRVDGVKVFEVRPSFRGDVARAQFYFAVRYGYTIDPIVESTLRGWHEADPVDERERIRNERIRVLQNNRNPFVDRPDFVDGIEDF